MYSAKIQWSILFWNCRWIHFCIKSNFIQHLKNSSIKNTSSFSSIKYYMFLTICYLSWVLVWAGRGESSYCLAGRTGTRGQISGGHCTGHPPSHAPRQNVHFLRGLFPKYFLCISDFQSLEQSKWRRLY